MESHLKEKQLLITERDTDFKKWFMLNSIFVFSAYSFFA